MLFAGWMGEVFSRQEFCMKTVTTIPGSSWQWQPGSYCIYQYGSACPQGELYWTARIKSTLQPCSDRKRQCRRSVLIFYFFKSLLLF